MCVCERERKKEKCLPNNVPHIDITIPSVANAHPAVTKSVTVVFGDKSISASS